MGCTQVSTDSIAFTGWHVNTGYTQTLPHCVFSAISVPRAHSKVLWASTLQAGTTCYDHTIQLGSITIWVTKGQTMQFLRSTETSTYVGKKHTSASLGYAQFLSGPWAEQLIKCVSIGAHSMGGGTVAAQIAKLPKAGTRPPLWQQLSSSGKGQSTTLPDYRDHQETTGHLAGGPQPTTFNTRPMAQ